MSALEIATGNTARLFFAVWPGPELQEALGELAARLKRECGGRAHPANKIHLTLVFLGEVARERIPQIEALAARVAAPRFELEMDRIEYWRRNRIVWAGTRPCPALHDLVACLESELATAGVGFERRPYIPHVTLLREARRAPASLAMPGLAWPVSRYVLLESARRERGNVYRILREWPLDAAA